MKKSVVGIICVLWAAVSMATVIFQDDFENNSGSLGGRLTDDGNATWETPQNMVVTNGVMVAGNGTKPGSGWISLPSLTAGDVITVSAVVVGNVSANSDWVGLGLTSDKSALYTGGNPYVTLTRQSVGGNPRGKATTYGGKGSGNELDNDLYLQEAGGFTIDLNARNTVKFEYDTATGNLKTWLISANNTEVLRYDGPVDYNGASGATIPLDQLNWLAVTFNTTEQDGSTNPAYVDTLSVEVIPEPATLGLFVVAGAGALTLRRLCR